MPLVALSIPKASKEGKSTFTKVAIGGSCCVTPCQLVLSMKMLRFSCQPIAFWSAYSHSRRLSCFSRCLAELAESSAGLLERTFYIEMCIVRPKTMCSIEVYRYVLRDMAGIRKVSFEKSYQCEVPSIPPLVQRNLLCFSAAMIKDNQEAVLVQVE